MRRDSFEVINCGVEHGIAGSTGFGKAGTDEHLIQELIGWSGHCWVFFSCYVGCTYGYFFTAGALPKYEEVPGLVKTRKTK